VQFNSIRFFVSKTFVIILLPYTDSPYHLNYDAGFGIIHLENYNSVIFYSPSSCYPQDIRLLETRQLTVSSNFQSRKKKL